MKRCIIGQLAIVIISCLYVPSAHAFNALDYFITTEGMGIKYSLVDTYDDLDTHVWFVSQRADRDRFTFTFNEAPESSDQWDHVDSTIIGRIRDQRIYFYGGCPSSNQGNIFFLLSLPTEVRDGSTWRFGEVEYSATYMENCNSGGYSFHDCLKIDFDSAKYPESYLRGKGYLLLVKGLGIVKIKFNRYTGGEVTLEYEGHRVFPPKNIKGRILNSEGSPYSGVAVSLSTCSESRAWTITDSNGYFTIKAYGPKVTLRIGYDNDMDGVMDYFDPPNYEEYNVYLESYSQETLPITFEGVYPGAAVEQEETPSNSPPVIDTFSVSPTEGPAPLSTTVICSAYDPDGYIVGYQLDFDGDGVADWSTSNSRASTTHTYISAGVYKVTCTAIDDKGLAFTSTTYVRVEETQTQEEVNHTGTTTPSQPPTTQVVGMADPDRSPVKLVSKDSFVALVSAFFDYSAPVDIAVGWMPTNFSTVRWLDPADCSWHEIFRWAPRTQSLHCPLLHLPGSDGYVFWLVSPVPLLQLDFSNGVYELRVLPIGD